MQSHFDLLTRTRAAGLHLVISGAVAALAAALVFGLWYPYPYRHLAGGKELFVLVTVVDVVLGPLLTFAVFNMQKGWMHLRRDLLFIGLIQLSALVYGLYTVFLARPVALVFEVDRFRVVTAAQVLTAELPVADLAYRQLPLTGPRLLGTREPQPGEERNDALFMSALRGVERGQRPKFWQPYANSRQAAMARAVPLWTLWARHPEQRQQQEEILRRNGIDPSAAKYLPVIGRTSDWVVILNDSGQPVHFVPVSAFD